MKKQSGISQYFLAVIFLAATILAFFAGRNENEENFKGIEVVSREHGQMLYKKAVLEWANDNSISIDEDELDSRYFELLKVDLKKIEKN